MNLRNYLLAVGIAAIGITPLMSCFSGSKHPEWIHGRVCPDKPDLQFYFPNGTFEADKKKRNSEAFRQQWYGKMLGAMKEPSLSCGPITTDERYRFTWLRSFHQPIAVRIERNGQIFTGTTVVLSGAGGYEPGAPSQQTSFVVNADQWHHFKETLQRAKWASLGPTDDIGGLDGAQWIIEGGTADQYHAVDRWTPDKGPYRDLGVEFLDLAGVKIPEKEMY